MIQLQVHQPPRVATKFASETVVRGLTATLQCRAEGDPDLKAEWNRDMQRIEPTSSTTTGNQKQRYTIKEEMLPSTRVGGIVSYLEINQANRLDSALFTCVVSNAYGSDSTNIQLIVQGKEV